MRLVNPAGLWLALLALPVLALHVLRPRRPPVEVSSTYLWREVARPVSVAQPWQRLRPSVALFLQLAAVALLTAAVARPVRVTSAPLAPHTVFVVDASGSMLALDGSPDRDGAQARSRLDSAKDRARHLRGELPSGGVASVVVADAQPRVVLTASQDRRAFEEAVGAVRATPGGADFATAFILAESLETPGTPIGFVLLSDGGLTDDEQRLLPPGTRYERMGSQSTNRAITRLSVEARGSGLHARVSVRNTGGPAAAQDLRLDVDGRTVARPRINLAPGQAVEVEVDLPAGERVEAFLEGEDLLAADNHAVAVAERRRDLKILWTGPNDLFLDRLFGILPGITVERSPEARPGPGYDLVVYDRVAVPDDPAAPFLAIAPPGGVPGARLAGTAENPAVTLVRTDDPLLAGLDLSAVAIATAQRVQAPADQVLVGAEGAPLLLRGTRGGRPFAYLTFALADSNLPLQVSFPLLADRLVTELAGAAVLRPDVRVGDLLPLGAGGTATTIDVPGGRTLSLDPAAPPPLADRAGFWTVRPQGRPALTLAVNPEPAESALAPADSLPVPERPQLPGERRPSGERPLLAWVAGAALAVVVAEYLWSRRRRGVSRGQWRVAIAARLAIVALLVAAMTGVTLTRQARRVAVVFLVDGSDSLGAAGRAAAFDWTREALARQPAGALAGVAVFGGDARLELTVGARSRLLAPAAKVDASRTNLAGALRLAGAVLPSDARRRIVVVSDGRLNEGDAAAEARRLREAGVEVDVHPVEVRGGADVAVERVDAPSVVHQGEAYTVRATVVASSAATVRLRWERDGRTVEERVADLPAGRSVVELAQVAGPEATGGLTRYRLDVAAADDAQRENDAGFAASQVQGPPRVLVAEGMAGEGSGLAAALRAGGITTELVPIAALPPLDALATYSSIVLVDVDARTLTAPQVASLGAVARDLGRGLVVVGGDRSYALGGYLGSELEKLLPVVSDVTDPKRRPSVAQVLAIDSSGSMGACHCSPGGFNGLPGGGNRTDGGGVNKTDISRAAAARTIAGLGANDQVGVLAFNTEQRWVIPLQQLPAEDVVTKGLRQLTPAGGTNLTLPLKEAGEALKASNASLRHIILFTDGFTSAAGLEVLAAQAAQLASQGITVSVLATGETGAAENLARVAEAGRGRFYNETDLSEVPQLMMQESILASRSLVNEGEFYPKVTSVAAPVRDLRQAPAVLGYVASTARPTSQVHLRVGTEDDPLLASWQLGLGKVTSWTSDASARWSQRWATWEGYTAFWSTVVKDTFPLATGAGSARARISGGRLEVAVDAADPWPDGSVATARVVGPDLAVREVALERVSGRTFVGDVGATAAGTYAAGVTVSGPGTSGAGPSGGTLFAATTLAVQSYSAEYEPGAPDPAELVRVSELSGGRGPIEAATAFDVADLVVGKGRVPLAGWFLLAAVLLWPLAVGLSRVALHGSGVAAVRRARVATSARLAGLAPFGRLRRVPAPSPSPSSPEPVRAPVRSPSGHRPAPAPPGPPAPPPTVERLLRRKRGEPPPDG